IQGLASNHRHLPAAPGNHRRSRRWRQQGRFRKRCPNFEAISSQKPPLACPPTAPVLASPLDCGASSGESSMTMSGNGGSAESPAPQQNQTQLNVLGQYIKDFSFENPNAPRSLAPTETQPAINIQINVGVQQLAPTDYEVTLKLEGKADSAGTVLF